MAVVSPYRKKLG